MSITLARVPGMIVQPATLGTPCMWCDDPADVTVTDRDRWTDTTCHAHLVDHFPGASIPALREPRCEVCGGRGCGH